MNLKLCFFAVLGLVTAEPVEIVTPMGEATTEMLDSYLQALKDSQGGTTATAANRYDEPITDPSPPVGYLPAKPSYHQPYGPPAPVAPQYGPPAPQYGPPIPFSGIPFASPATAISSLLSGLMPKGIDLETVFKIILKLTLFKILVKFFAVICLLLAYPLFQSKDKKPMMEEEEEEEEDRQLNNLTAFVWDAIDPGNYTESIERIVSDVNANMTQPSETAAIAFLEFCVNLANLTINWMSSTLRRRNGNSADSTIWKLLVLVWSKLSPLIY